MSDNHFDRLRETIRAILARWRTAESYTPGGVNAVHETTLTLVVMEPLLDALEWTRLSPDAPKNDGAAYEWPANNHVDIALLVNSIPVAFAELKDDQSKAAADLRKKLADKRFDLSSARIAVAAWWKKGPGLAWYELSVPQIPLPKPKRTFAVLEPTEECVTGIADLARPVLLREATKELWLQQHLPSAEPPGMRIDLRKVQEQFFATLKSSLGLNCTMQLRRSVTDTQPATPTFAYADLPGVLPLGWGLVFQVHPTLEYLECFFYEGSDKMIDKTRRFRFRHSVTPNDIDKFITTFVMPHITERKRLADADGSR